MRRIALGIWATMLVMFLSGCYSERRHFVELHGFAVRGVCLTFFVTDESGVLQVVRGADTLETYVPRYLRLFAVTYSLGDEGGNALAGGGVVAKAWEGATSDESRGERSRRMREVLSVSAWREFGASWRLGGGSGWEEAESRHIAESVAAKMEACGFDVTTLRGKAKCAEGDVYLGWGEEGVAVCMPGSAVIKRMETPGAEDAVWLPTENRLVVVGAPVAGSVTPLMVWDWNYASGKVDKIRLRACAESQFRR